VSVYFIEAENGLIKIGMSDNPKKRFRSLRTMSPIKIELVKWIKLDRTKSFILEQRLHKIFKSYRVHGEWFLPSPDLIKYIQGEVSSPAENCSELTKNFDIMLKQLEIKLVTYIHRGEIDNDAIAVDFKDKIELLAKIFNTSVTKIMGVIRFNGKIK
jgi:hypothetical protein